MPKTKRDNLKRKVDYAVGILEHYCVHLLDLRAEYAPHYPQYVQALDLMLTLATQLIEFTQAFRRKV